MKKKIIHIVQRSFFLLLALQILNLSTDSINFMPFQTDNITEFNDLNTITEYVTEVVLGHKNLFPETAEADHHKQNQAQMHITLKMYHPFILYTGIHAGEYITNFGLPSDEKNIHLFSGEINPPPPRLV